MQILEWPAALARRITLNRLDVVEPLSFERHFQFWEHPKVAKELCRDCTEAGGAVQSCVSTKIAAQGSMYALARYSVEEASHCLTRNAVVFFEAEGDRELSSAGVRKLSSAGMTARGRTYRAHLFRCTSFPFYDCIPKTNEKETGFPVSKQSQAPK